MSSRLLYTILFAFALMFLILSCKPNQYVPKPGDLLFHIDRDSDFADAIVTSPTSSVDYAFSHVAII